MFHSISGCFSRKKRVFSQFHKFRTLDPPPTHILGLFPKKNRFFLCLPLDWKGKVYETPKKMYFRSVEFPVISCCASTDDEEHMCDFTCAACGFVKIIENANNTHKEGKDTKESQKGIRMVLRERSSKEVQRRANMRIGCEAWEPELETLRRSRAGLHRNKANNKASISNDC